jgi:hypothetical protein
MLSSDPWLWAKKFTKGPSTLVLLAEIKGKGCPELEGVEDLITSAVFGHLRSVPPGIFWHMLLSKAKNVADPPISLAQELKEKGVDFSQFHKLQVLFWEACGVYGEPDIVLRFTNADGLSIVIVVEVKLNSAKSSSGETDDQLERYLRLLDDDGFHLEWKMASACRFVMYLTRVFARDEITESIERSQQPDASRRIFGLEWNDILDAANANRGNLLLAEVAEFLRRRGLARFRGFSVAPDVPINAGSFYRGQYFVAVPDELRLGELRGSFYGR